MMSVKIHWNLLIFFAVLCQGIIGTLSEKNIDESLEIHVRQKRVINTSPDGDRKELIKNAPYVVSVKRLRSQFTCVGVILTHYIVLTVAKCVEFQLAKLRVYSGSAQAVNPNIGNADIHNVTDKRIHMANIPFRPQDGIALVAVTPSFTYRLNTYNIPFYERHIQPGSYGIVSGWGCHSHTDRRTAHPHYLRTIKVPIISNNDCKIFYVDTLPIVESDLCTLDATGQQYCGIDDTGAPLVIEINYTRYLVGIHLWNGGVKGRANPDVFVDLQHPKYKQWIRETMQLMETSVHSALQP